MSKTNQNFSVYSGESKTVFVALFNKDGTPFDTLTPGLTMQWWMARTPYALSDDAEVMVKKSFDSDITRVTGGININLGADDTTWPPAIYYHELKVFTAIGHVALAMSGICRIRPALDMRERPDVLAGSAVIAGTGTVQ